MWQNKKNVSFFQCTFFYRINKDNFERLTDEISELFPKEEISYYYEKAYVIKNEYDNENQGRINSSGSFYSEYLKIREIGRICGIKVGVKATKQSKTGIFFNYIIQFF